jgi:hypothetical protein
MANILVGGIVAYRDKRPYVQIDVDGHMVQLSVAEARSVAVDIFRQASRAEADAMIYKYFAAHDLPETAAGKLMVDFRNFRSQLDSEKVESGESSPDDPIGGNG